MPGDHRIEIILAARDVASRAFTQFEGRVRSLTTSLTSFNGILGTLAAGYGVRKIGEELWTTALRADSLEKSMIAAAGGVSQAAEATEFIRKESERLGLVLPDQLDLFKKITAASKGMKLEGAGVKEIYLGIAEAGTALGMSGEEVKGALRAVEQMMSKGKVQAEELRGQLGERLPGAFQLAAKAMGVTTAELNKMLEQGKVISDDFLPKFAKALREQYGDAAIDASRSGQAATNRMVNSWYELKKTVMDAGIYDAAIEGIEGITESMRDWIDENDELIKQKIPEYVDGIKSSLEGLMDFYDALPGWIIGAAGYGILGRMILGAGPPGWIVAAIAAVTLAMKEIDYSGAQDVYENILPGVGEGEAAIDFDALGFDQALEKAIVWKQDLEKEMDEAVAALKADAAEIGETLSRLYGDETNDYNDAIETLKVKQAEIFDEIIAKTKAYQPELKKAKDNIAAVLKAAAEGMPDTYLDFGILAENVAKTGEAAAAAAPALVDVSEALKEGAKNAKKAYETDVKAYQVAAETKARIDAERIEAQDALLAEMAANAKEAHEADLEAYVTADEEKIRIAEETAEEQKKITSDVSAHAILSAGDIKSALGDTLLTGLSGEWDEIGDIFDRLMNRMIAKAADAAVDILWSLAFGGESGGASLFSGLLSGGGGSGGGGGGSLASGGGLLVKGGQWLGAKMGLTSASPAASPAISSAIAGTGPGAVGAAQAVGGGAMVGQSVFVGGAGSLGAGMGGEAAAAAAAGQATGAAGAFMGPTPLIAAMAVPILGPYITGGLEKLLGIEKGIKDKIQHELAGLDVQVDHATGRMEELRATWERTGTEKDRLKFQEAAKHVEELGYQVEQAENKMGKYWSADYAARKKAAEVAWGEEQGIATTGRAFWEQVSTENIPAMDLTAFLQRSFGESVSQMEWHEIASEMRTLLGGSMEEEENAVKMAIALSDEGMATVEQQFAALGFVAADQGWASQAALDVMGSYVDNGIDLETLREFLVEQNLDTKTINEIVGKLEADAVSMEAAGVLLSEVFQAETTLPMGEELAAKFVEDSVPLGAALGEDMGVTAQGYPIPVDAPSSIPVDDVHVYYHPTSARGGQVGFAGGGWLSRHPGGGMIAGGSGARDDVFLGTGPSGLNYWGMGREYVVNQKATRRFLPILEAINALGLAGGGSVGPPGISGAGAAGGTVNPIIIYENIILDGEIIDRRIRKVSEANRLRAERAADKGLPRSRRIY